MHIHTRPISYRDSGSDRSLYSPRAYRVRGTNLWIASGPRGRTGSEIGAGYRQHLLEAATVSEKASLDESQHSSDRNAAAMDEAGEENEESNLKNLTLTLPPEVATEPSTPTAKCPEKHHSRQPSSSFWMDINRRAYGEEQLDELDELHLSHHSEEDTTADENDLPYDPRIFAGGAGTWLGPPSPATPTTLDHPDVAMTSSSGDVHTATLATDNGAPAITGASGGSVSSQELDMDWTARISSRRRSSYSSLSQGFSRRSRKLWHQISASYSAAMVASPEETEEEEEDDREGGLLVNLSGKDDEASYSISSPPSSSLLRPPRSSRKKASGLSEATVIFRPLTTRIRPSPLRHQQQDSLDEKEGQVTRDRATSEDNSTGGCDSTAREATLVGGMASCSSDNDSNEKDESVDPFYYYYYDEFNNSNINRGINNKVYRGRMGRSYGSYNQLNFDSRIEDNGMSGKESSRWTLNILEEKARIQLAKVWHKVGHMVSPRSKHSAVFRSTSTRQEVDEQEAGLPEEMSNEEPWKSHWTLSTSSTSPTLHSHHPHDRPNGPLNSSSSISSYTSSSTSTSARAAGVNHKVKSAVPGIGEGLLRSNTRASRSTTLPSSVRAAVSNLKRQASRRFSVKSEKSTTPEACDWRQQYQHQLQLNPPVMPKTELPPSSTNTETVVPHPLAQQSHHGLLYQDDTSNITNYYHDSGQLTSEYKGEQTMDGHSWQGLIPYQTKCTGQQQTIYT
ncbi:hypothetical protein BGZ73_000923 [Actinomortierella ambigua]|nr:hypothetical protein BGZ73_000923 [Actinomortierella ambigua]